MTQQTRPPGTPRVSELVLFNGKVLTVDAAFTIAEAVAVRDGRVLAVGSTADIKRLIGPETRVVDLAGKTVVPGSSTATATTRLRAATSIRTRWSTARSARRFAARASPR